MLSRNEILGWLRKRNPVRLQELWEKADAVRKANVGDAVHLRGLIEFSNECVRKCSYCGMNASNYRLTRYCLTDDEIVACAKTAFERGYGSVVLQSGYNPEIPMQWLGDIIAQIKKSFGLAVTLSIGERTISELKHLKLMGADRYLLRFETSDLGLYQKIKLQKNLKSHPRIRLLQTLRELGYEIGGGIMIGLPGQTYSMVARDIELFQKLDLDMVGVGPYIPHPGTILGKQFLMAEENIPGQIPNSALFTRKVIALTRLACPQSNIPATTALANISSNGFIIGLRSGANVIMPNLTPEPFRSLYSIYPTTSNHIMNYNHFDILDAIAQLNRKPGTGHGGRVKFPAGR
ncbi:MAG: [FeFe] hydrogenase H-cluster radical SAM maturase HydE [Candidatus Zixiibacteriota bacterium]